MNIERATVDVDINLTNFESAVGKIRALPKDVTLYCAQSCVCVAVRIAEEHSCKFVLVPDELLKNVFCWAVIGNDSMYWSLPAA